MVGNIADVWADMYYKKSLLAYMIKGYAIRNKKYIIATICRLVNNHMVRSTEEDILRAVHRYLSTFPRRDLDRPGERARTIMKILGNVRCGNGLNVGRYLDYGCGDGSITIRLGSQLGMHMGNVFGIDQHVCAAPFNYVNCAALSDLSAEGFDLVTAFVSFHHIKDIARVLITIYKLLSPHGLLIIREHDCSDPKLTKYLNLIHLWNGVKKPHATPEYIKYRSSAEWDRLIESAGFHNIGYAKYSGNNPQGLYYACYAKKRNN